jgi:hypothetical protein
VLIDVRVHLLPPRRLASPMKWMPHPAGMGTLAEVYEVLDGLGLPERVKENVLGRAAQRFVEGFRPGFFAWAAARPR